MILHSKPCEFNSTPEGFHNFYKLYCKKGVDTPVEEEKKEEFIKENEFKV